MASQEKRSQTATSSGLFCPPGEPAQKKQRAADVQDDYIDRVILRVEGPHENAEVYIPRSKLTSEYFKAKLERWQASEGPPSITFEVPEGCRGLPGLSIMQRRILEGDQVWPSGKWLAQAKGDKSILLTLLYLFDLVLWEPFCCEVVEVMKRCRLSCPEPYHSIGKKFDKDLMLLPPPCRYFVADPQTLQRLVQDAVENKGKLLDLAERALAGAERRDAMSALLATFSTCFDLKNLIGKVGILKTNFAIPWVIDQIEQLVRRHPQEARTVVDGLRAEASSVTSKKINIKTDSLFSSEWIKLVVDLAFTVLDLLFAHGCSLESSFFEREEHVELVHHYLVSLDFLLRHIHAPPQLEAPLSEVIATAPPWLQAVVIEKLRPNPQPYFLERPRLLLLQALVPGRAHLLHGSVRHELLSITHLLSAEDKDFLANADFPALEQGLCQPRL